MTPNLMEFNADELEAPKWLNSDFLTKVLQNCEKGKNIFVKSFKMTPGTGKGDHYASIMFRANVAYTNNNVNEQKSMIIKIMPEVEGFKKEMFKDTKMFETEIGMYTDVIPKFHEILKAAGDNTVLGAKCLYYSVEPKSVIVFEDLVALNYIVIRKRPLNFYETKLCLTKLAKWNAASYKILQETPEYFDNYRYAVLSQSSFYERDFMNRGIEQFMDMLNATETLHEYRPYFEKLKGTLFSKCKALTKEYRDNPQPGTYYVLCHGDFHSRNMMFRMQTENDLADDVMLLDFQFCYVGSIVNDLIYMKFMVLDEETRINHWDELLYFYFTTFLETLKNVNYKGPLPKYTEFRKQFILAKELELFLAVTFYPIMCAFFKENFEVEEFMTSREYSKSFYYDDKFQKNIHDLLKKYKYEGYFEDL